MTKTRDTYKYKFKIGNKIVHGGITNDLDRREAEHKQKWPNGHIKQDGRKTTEDAKWRMGIRRPPPKKRAIYLQILE